MSQLEKNQNSHLHNFRISLVLITIITIIDIIITTVNGLPLEASSSSSNLQNISSEKIAGIQKNNNYEIAEELKKCGLEKYDTFVLPFTTYDDPIRILVSNNIADQIIARIFGLIAHVIGYQKVQYVPLESQNILGNKVFQKISLEGASNDKNNGNLNISMSLNAKYLPQNYRTYDHGIDLGPITMPGFYGLYNVNAQFPREKELNYKILQKNEQNTSETILNLLNIIENKQYYKSELCEDDKSCATIIAQDYKESKFIEKYIEFYKLRVQVYWLGENFKNTLAILLNSYKSQGQFFVLSWSPSDITHVMLESKAVIVKMPSCTEAWNSFKVLYGKCMFDPIPQVKYVDGLLRKVPILYNYLRDQFTFTNDQYLSLIRDYENNQMNIEDFACNWLKKHPEFYTEKIKKSYSDDDYKIIVALYAPNFVKLNPILAVARNATQLLKDLKWSKFQIELHIDTEQGYADPSRTVQVTQSLTKAKQKIVIGPSKSSQMEVVAALTKSANIPLITYLPNTINSKDQHYEHTFHTCGSSMIYVNITIELMKKHKWKHLFVLTEDGLSHTTYVTEMSNQFNQHGFQLLRYLFSDSADKDIEISLDNIIQEDYKIIFIDVEPETYLKIMRLAENRNMTFENKYVWITPQNLNDVKIHSNDTTLMDKMFKGTLTINPSPFGNLNAPLQIDNRTTADWKSDYERQIPSNTPYFNYGPFIYDTLIAIGLAIKEIELNNRNQLATIGNSNLTEHLIEILKHKIDFHGVTGQFVFDPVTRTRNVDFSVMQWWNWTYIEVEKYRVKNGKLEKGEFDYKWMNDKTPDDRTMCSLNIPCKDLAKTIWMIAACFILITVSSVSFLYWRHRFNKAKEKYERIIEKCKLQSSEISPSDITLEREIGTGHYANVTYGLYKNNGKELEVAVKQLKGEKYLREFFYEAEMLKDLRHENIIKLEGVYFHEGKFHIVMEYVVGDSLYKFLKSKRKSFNESCRHGEVDSMHLTSIAKDIARALKYLEDKKIAHRDIAARNVLLSPQNNGHYVAKLSDFGLAVNVTSTFVYIPRDKTSYLEMPVRTMAPEFIKEAKHSFKSDIWSFGILLYEILTYGGIPYGQVKEKDIEQHIREGNHVELPERISEDLKSLMLKCFDQDPENRPSASEILVILQNSPSLIQPCFDQNIVYSLEPSVISNGSIISSHFSSHPHNHEVTYSSINTDYTELRDVSSITSIPAENGNLNGYTELNKILCDNSSYNASNASDRPLLQENFDYLQMNPIDTKRKGQNHDRYH